MYLCGKWEYLKVGPKGSGVQTNTRLSLYFVLTFSNFILATANATCLRGIAWESVVFRHVGFNRLPDRHHHQQHYEPHKDVVLPREMLLPAFELVPFEMMTRSLHKQIFLKTTAAPSF